MFDRCDHIASPKQIQRPERGRKRDTRLSRYDSVCILCRCVTVSLCHCPTVSPFTCLTDVITQHPRNKFSFPSEGASGTYVSQGMTACAYCVAVSLCHCVTVSLSHCATVDMFTVTVPPPPPPTVSCVGTFMKLSLPPVCIHVSHGHCVTVSLSTVRRCHQFKSRTWTGPPSEAVAHQCQQCQHERGGRTRGRGREGAARGGGDRGGKAFLSWA